MKRQTIRRKILHLVLSGVLLFSLGATALLPQTVSASSDEWALNFDGVDDYVEVANHPIFNFGLNDFSVSLWINWDIGKSGVGADVIGGNLGNFLLHKSSLNSIHVSDGTVWPVFGISAAFGAWEQYVITRQGGTFYTYRNGVAINNFTPDPVWDVNFAVNPLYIGSAQGWTRFFAGLIDEVRIYNRAITAAEVSYNYNTGMGRYTPYDQTELVAWWHMDESTGPTIDDETVNANHGTIYGATWVAGKAFPAEALGPVELWHEGSWAADYDTIQEAIDAAEDGDTIKVHEGTYYEQIVIGKQITVKSQDGAATTIIDAGEGTDVAWEPEPGFTIYPAVLIERDGVVFGDTDMGFTIRNTFPTEFPWGEEEPSELGVAILADAPGVTIRGNTIENSNPVGIFADVEMTIISQNTVSASIMGIFSGGGGGSITENIVDSGYVGIAVESGQGNNNVSNNTVSNTWGGAIMVQLGDGHQITNNELYDNQGTAIMLQNVSNATVSGNTISAATTSIAAEYGIDVQGGNNNDISGNTISDVLVGGITLNESHGNNLSANNVSNIDGYTFSGDGGEARWTREEVRFDRFSVKLWTGDDPSGLPGEARLEIPMAFPFQYFEMGGELYFWAYLLDTALLPTYQIVLDNGVILEVDTGREEGLITTEWLKLSAMGFWTNVATGESKSLSAWIDDPLNAGAEIVRLSVIYSGAANMTIYIDGSQQEGFQIEPAKGIAIARSNRNSVSGSTVSYVKGAGILIVESYQNRIGDNNTISNNGTGVVIENSDENTVSGSTISNNAKEGIIIIQSHGNQIIGNDITGNTGGMSGIHLDGESGGNEIHANNIVGNTVWVVNGVNEIVSYGVFKEGGDWVNATGNWWGDASGPYHERENPGGTGDAVSNEFVHFEPWADTLLPESIAPTMEASLAMPRMTALLGMFMGDVGPEWTSLIVEAYDNEGGVGIAQVTVDLKQLLMQMLPGVVIPEEKQAEWDRWLSELERSQLWHRGNGVYERHFNLRDEFMNQLRWYLGEEDTQRIMDKLTLGDFSIPVIVTDWGGNEVGGNIDLTIVDILQPLKEGWNLISTPVTLDDSYATLMDIFDLGGGFIYGILEDVMWYDPSFQGWGETQPTDELKPLGTYYIYVSGNTQIGIIFNREPTPLPMLNLGSGWNLVGLAIPPTLWDSMPVNEAMVTVEDAQGYRGYSIVVSPDQRVDYNEEYRYQEYGFGGYHWKFEQSPWVYTLGSDDIKEMSIGGGYWVFMEANDTLAGFSTTPVTRIFLDETGHDIPMVPRYDRERTTRTDYQEYHDGGYTKIHLTYSGDVSPSRVVEFYQQRMAEYGWELTTWEGSADSASLDFALVAGETTAICRIDVVGGESIKILFELWEPGVDLPYVPRFDWGPVAMTTYSQTTDSTGTQTNISYEGEIEAEDAYNFYKWTLEERLMEMGYPDPEFKWEYIGEERHPEWAWLMFRRTDEEETRYIGLIWAEKGIIEIKHYQFAASVSEEYIETVISLWRQEVEMRMWWPWEEPEGPQPL